MTFKIHFAFLLLTILFTVLCYGQNVSDNYGRRQGYWKIYYPDGTLQKEGFFVNNHEDSIWKTYWSNGKIQYLIQYRNGEPNGIYETYDENGRLKGDGKMQEGQLNGIFISYDTTATIVSISYWELGELKDEKIFSNEARETGTIEIINGKKYLWVNGKKIEVK